ncbi:MAG: SusC/RagA family TonB-linked outer membrane protein [Odoribacter sp.]
MKKTIQKLIWVMIKIKLMCLVVTVGCLSLNAEVWSQQKRIDLRFEQIDLAELFGQIQKKTDLKFVFNHEDVQGYTARGSMTNKTVTEILDLAFQGKPFSYEIVNDHVIVSHTDASSQQTGQQEVTGRVTDEQGVPLPGVSVLIKGTTLGVATDVSGNFKILIPNANTATLVFSMIGMKAQEVKLKPSQLFYSITMHIDSQSLDDVVCTGYQTLSKINTTGSFSTIKPEVIEMRSSIGLDRLLEGSIPGLTVYRTDIRIRGGSTINSGTKPLFIVDGFEVDELPENMDVVKRITVLKDAAAAAIWGARAANGVVVIETKKGEKGKTRISYSGNFRVMSKDDYNDLNHADGKTIVDYDLEAFDKKLIGGYIFEGGSNGYSPAYGAIFDCEKGDITREELLSQLNAIGSVSNKKQIKDKLLRNAFTQHHNISLSGGSDKLTYFLSANYMGSHSGYQGGDKDQSFNIMSKNNYEIIPELTLRGDINVIYDKQKGGYEEISSAINELLPYQLLYDEKTGERILDYTRFNTVENKRLMGIGYRDNGFNILDEIDLANNQKNQMNVRTKFGIDLNLLEGLLISADYQYERTHSEQKNIKDENSFEVRRNIINQFTTEENGKLTYNLPEGDVLDQAFTNGTTHSLKTGISFNKTFGQDEEHYINAIGGFDLRKHTSNMVKSRKLGYNDELQSWKSFDQDKMNSEGITWWNGDWNSYDATYYDKFSYNDNREASWYGSLVYTYDRRYSLSGTFRIDKSNLFGADKKYRRNPLWSVGAGWNIQEEDFFHSKVINRLVPRITYGLTGNFDRSGRTTPLLVARRSYSSSSKEYYTRVQTPPNPKLRWERTKTLNIGIEAELFNRLNISAEYYDKHSYDLLGDMTIDPTLGFNSTMINAADMRNRGVEILLNADLIQSKDFNWNLNFVFGYNKNKIVKNKISDGSPEINRPRGVIQFVESYPREALWSYRWAGLDATGDPQTFDAEGNKTKKAVLESLECSGTYLPKYNGSLSTDFKYKNITLMFSFVYNFGHVFRMEYPGMNPFEATDLSTLVANRWKQEGDEAHTDIPAMLTWDHYFDGRDRLARYSSNSIRKGGVIRLREILLNYELPKNWLSKTPFQRISLTAQGNTLWKWTKNKEKIDPEFVDPIHGTLSLSEQPSFTFGVRLEF